MCVLFPSLSAMNEGYKVYAIVDASGDVSTRALDITISRMSEAGVIPANTNSLIAELMKSWKRPDAPRLPGSSATLLPATRPSSKVLIQSFNTRK
jgi:hypothetical protein